MTSLSSLTSMADAFQRTAAAHPDAIAIRRPGDSPWLTWRECVAHVERTARGLNALGVRPGDTVAIMLTNRPEFHIVDAAAFHLGATPFSLTNTSSLEQIRFILASARPSVVFSERLFLETLWSAAEDSNVRTIVCVDGNDGGALSLEQLERLDNSGFDFESTWGRLTLDSVLTLVCPARTSGRPTVVPITHGHMLAELEAASTILPTGAGDRVISFLPVAHIAHRWAAHYLLAAFGVEVRSAGDQAMRRVMLEQAPSRAASVPANSEEVTAAIEAMASARSEERVMAAFQEALRVGIQPREKLQGAGTTNRASRYSPSATPTK